MPKYPARPKHADKLLIDVNNSLYKEVEERVFQWLRARGFRVLDTRSKKLHYDFVLLDSGRTLDVKCDIVAHTSGRVAWEVGNSKGDAYWAGWGRAEELDYVAFVIPQTWTMYLLDAEVVRHHIDRWEKGIIDVEPGDIIEHKRPGKDGLGTHFYAISLNWLQRMGCVKLQEVLA